MSPSNPIPRDGGLHGGPLGRVRTTPLPPTVTALDAAVHNLALSIQRGKDRHQIAHLAENVGRASGSVAAMGQITTWANQYDQGLIDLETLVANLKGFDFKTPARFKGIPEDLHEAELQAEDRTYEDEDTMDEVYAARDRGLLDLDALVAITEALEPVDG